MKKLLLLLFTIVMATSGMIAQKMVHGTVTDDSGSPLIGASVVVKDNPNVGTITDIDGKFQLKVDANAKALVISYIGFTTQEVELGASDEINVTLTSGVQLEDVVVTALGIKKDQKKLGYAVQKVGSEEIEKSGAVDVLSALNGKASNVRITRTSGAAGGASYIEIRGAASLTQDNQPLFVVDGIPIDNSNGGGGYAGVAPTNRAMDLNPEDIESINVLKGGAATALYGMRAANGAIVITTKKGSAAKTKDWNVNYSASYGISEISQVPALNTKFAQGYGGQWYSGIFSSWGPRMDTCAYSLAGKNDFDVHGSIVSKNSPDADGGPVTPFNQFDFFQKGAMLNNYISISKASDKGSFFLSLSNSKNKGTIPNNTYDKNSIKLSSTTNLTDKLTFTASANFINTAADKIQQGSNTSGVMLGLMRTPPSFDNAAGYELPDGRQRNYRGGGGYDNPYWTANKNLFNENVNRLIGLVETKYQLTDNLSILYRLGLDTWTRRYKDYLAVYSRTHPSGLNSVSHSFKRDFNSDLMLNYNKKLTSDIGLDVVLGHNMTERYYNGVSSTANDLVIPNYYNLNNTTDLVASEGTSKIRRMGVFGDVTLDFRSMLFLELTGRNDWSTTLPEKNNSFFYPSVNLGFVFTELDAFSGMSDILSYGKLRASYAVIAHDAPAYRTLTYYYKASPGDGWTDGITFPFQGSNAFTLGNTVGSNDLRPEKTTSYEFGIDLKFFNNRLGLDAAYYNNKGEDLLLSVDIARSTGYSSMFVNAGAMTNKGIELTFYANPVKTSLFNWDFTVNFAKNNNLVDKLADGVENIYLGGFTSAQVRAEAGEAYRTIYTYDWTRDDNGNVIIYSDGFPRGDYSLYPVGSVDPDFTMSYLNNFGIGNFNFSFLLDWKKGGKMWNGTRGALYYFGAHKDTETREEGDKFVFDGVNENGEKNTIEVVKDQNWYLGGEGSGFTGPGVDFIEDAGWVRLRELTLSYDLGKKMLKNTKYVNSLSIYFTGRNLWLKTPFTGIDPETNLLGASNAQGLEYFNMPGTKDFVFGVKLGL